MNLTVEGVPLKNSFLFSICCLADLNIQKIVPVEKWREGVLIIDEAYVSIQEKITKNSVRIRLSYYGIVQIPDCWAFI